MYHISLLPVKYKQAITAERKKNDVILSFIFTVIILSMLYLLTFVVNASVKSDLASVKAENGSLLAEIGALSEYRGMQTQISGIHSEIVTLAGEAPSFPRVITEITQSVPDSLQITDITFYYEKDTGVSKFEVLGNSAYYDDVASWIDTLNGIENIGEVFCSYTTYSDAAEKSRVRFELKMDILDKSAADDVVWRTGE